MIYSLERVLCRLNFVFQLNAMVIPLGVGFKIMEERSENCFSRGYFSCTHNMHVGSNLGSTVVRDRLLMFVVYRLASPIVHFLSSTPSCRYARKAVLRMWKEHH